MTRAAPALADSPAIAEYPGVRRLAKVAGGVVVVLLRQTCALPEAGGAVASMSRTGNRHDNAPAELLYASMLSKELVMA